MYIIKVYIVYVIKVEMCEYYMYGRWVALLYIALSHDHHTHTDQYFKLLRSSNLSCHLSHNAAFSDSALRYTPASPSLTWSYLWTLGFLKLIVF